MKVLRLIIVVKGTISISQLSYNLLDRNFENTPQKILNYDFFRCNKPGPGEGFFLGTFKTNSWELNFSGHKLELTGA